MSACGVCGAEPLVPVLELQDHEGHPAALARCSACSLVQATQRPSNEVLEGYYSRYCYTGEAAWQISEATAASIERVVSGLESYRKTNRCLDVGCGTAGFLTALRRRGWLAEGTELSVEAAERLARMGFRIHGGAVEDLRVSAGSYDVVLMSEVIEHLRDPRAAVANIASALRRGGVLYLTTPNYGSLSRLLLAGKWRVISVPEHLFYFSRRSLAPLLRSVGLRPLKLWTEGVNPYELLAPFRGPGGTGARPVGAAKDGGEALRLLALRRPGVGALKSLVNFGLRASGLGDTLKCLAIWG